MKRKVEFEGHLARDLGRDCAVIKPWPPPRDKPEDHLKVSNIQRDEPRDLRMLDLDHDVTAIGEASSMNLRQARGCKGGLVEAREKLCRGTAKLALDGLSNLRYWSGRNTVLESGEGGRIRLGEYVGPCARELADLYIQAAERRC